MGNQPESRLSRAIQKALRATYGDRLFIFKVHGGPTMMAGLPDLIGCVDGRMFGLEVKMPTGKVSERQTYVHEVMQRAGAFVDVPRSVAEALEQVAACVDEGARPRARQKQSEASS